MKTKPYRIAAAFLAVLSFSFAQERVERSELPERVQQTLQDSAENADVQKITRRSQDGRTVFEVELEQQNDQKARLTIAEDGSVVNRTFTTGTAASTTTAASGSSNQRNTNDSDMNRSSTASSRSTASSSGNTQTASASTTNQNEQQASRTSNRQQQGSERSQGTAQRGETEADPVTGVVIVEQVELRPIDTESMIPLAQLPPAVQRGIEREAPGREIADIDRELWNGRVVYEVEFRDSGVNPQLHFTEDGSLVPGGTDFTDSVRNLFAGTQVTDTPPAVQDVIRQEAANGRVTDVDIERRTGDTVYEVEIEDARGQYEIHLAEDGTIVKHDRMLAE